MYYVVYGLLYAFSLLPLRVLYLFSSLAYLIVYHIAGYRKEVVFANLAIAFPEKTEQERKKIAKQFYLNFIDTFIESIKMISISKKELERRASCETDYINELIDKGRNVHIMAGHQFNWEFANLLYGKNLRTNFVGIYQPIGNKILNKIFYDYRRRYGSIMISTKEFTSKMHTVFSKQYALALAADQNPSKPDRSFWLNFFGKPAPFITGPGKGAVKHNTAVVYIAFKKIKRGYYSFTVVPIVDNGADHTAEELTLLYKNVLETTIRNDPANYLWSHRRWRHEWKEGYSPVME